MASFGSGWKVCKIIQLMWLFLKAFFWFVPPALSLLCIDDFPDDVIFNIAVCVYDTTLYSKCDQAFDLWQ